MGEVARGSVTEREKRAGKRQKFIIYTQYIYIYIYSKDTKNSKSSIDKAVLL